MPHVPVAAVRWTSRRIAMESVVCASEGPHMAILWSSLFSNSTWLDEAATNVTLEEGMNEGPPWIDELRGYWRINGANDLWLSKKLTAISSQSKQFLTQAALDAIEEWWGKLKRGQEDATSFISTFFSPIVIFYSCRGSSFFPPLNGSRFLLKRSVVGVHSLTQP